MREEVEVAARTDAQLQEIIEPELKWMTLPVGGDVASRTIKVREEYMSSMQNKCELMTGRYMRKGSSSLRRFTCQCTKRRWLGKSHKVRQCMRSNSN